MRMKAMRTFAWKSSQSFQWLATDSNFNLRHQEHLKLTLNKATIKMLDLNWEQLGKFELTLSENWMEWRQWSLRKRDLSVFRLQNFNWTVINFLSTVEESYLDCPKLRTFSSLNLDDVLGERQKVGKKTKNLERHQKICGNRYWGTQKKFFIA